MAGPPHRRGPIRIVFSHYTADIAGGSDRSLFDLVTHLPRDRFLPTVILRTGDPLAPAYRTAGMDVVETRLAAPRRALELRKLAAFSLGYWPSVFRVARTIRSRQADLVHVNTLYNLVGPAAARLAGRPLVWHVRELVADSRLVPALLKLVALLATRAVAISPAVADTLRDCNDRLRVIPNGIDLEEYRVLPDPGRVRGEFGLAADQPLVTTIGRLEPWKGQHVLVEAVPGILARHPNLRVLIVGGAAINKPEYATRLKARCDELGVGGAVTFTGIRKDVPAILAASNVLVLPSATPEPFGRTVVEAMAACCPVVATAAGGPLDIVVDGETGRLVPPNDPKALAEKINDLLDHPDEARAMGERGRQRAHERFSLDRLVRDMTGLFEEVVAEV